MEDKFLAAFSSSRTLRSARFSTTTFGNYVYVSSFLFTDLLKKFSHNYTKCVKIVLIATKFYL